MQRKFCEINNILLTRSPPYWAQANGEVENMNKSLVKRFKIAYVNRDDYRKEIQKFMLMYNVTPHGTTGVSPSELMFNRTIRDKLPTVQDVIECDGSLLYMSVKDMDLVNKHKGKEREDKNRQAKQSDIKVGDKVLLQNVIFPHKLTTKFSPTKYHVIQRNGNEVVIDDNGRTLRRNIGQVKKLPEIDHNCKSQNLTSEPSQSPSPTHQLDESNSYQSNENNHNESSTMDSNPRLTLKLKKLGGMWRPVHIDRDVVAEE